MTLAPTPADATTTDADPDTAPIDHVIVTPDTGRAYTFAPSYAAASARLRQLLQEDERRFCQATIATYDDYVAAREQSYLDQPLTQIDSGTFHQALNVLPPLAWKREDGVERFNLSEFTEGYITQQYARLGQRYFTKPVRHGDLATYMSRDSIERFLDDQRVGPTCRSLKGDRLSTASHAAVEERS